LLRSGVGSRTWHHTDAEPDLRAVPDFGLAGPDRSPLFLWLKWTYNHIVPNWGWAIVLQTLIINLALLPLRLSQMKSDVEDAAP